MLEHGEMHEASKQLTKHHPSALTLAAVHHTCRHHLDKAFGHEPEVHARMVEMLAACVESHAARLGLPQATQKAHRDVSRVMGTLTYLDALPA
jgi:hypothetical protein